ncbi:MAG: hydroxyphenylacetyl-CoA thioesterase PaaI [Pseudomonadota bacterium]
MDSRIMNAEDLARQVGEAMYPRDRAAQSLGITLEDIRPGYARMRMTVRPDMLNGHALCHGGFLFTLCDTAFAYACNSHNHNTVAAGCSIEYLAPAFEGDVLTAEAREHVLHGRTGIYDVDVTDQHGKRIVAFRGKSHRIKGAVTDPPPDLRKTDQEKP